MHDEPRRRTPRTDAVLADPAVDEAGRRLGRPVVKAVVGRGAAGLPGGDVAPDDVVAVVLERLPPSAPRCARSSTRPASSCTPTSAGHRCPRPPSTP